jgi:hypothetical protein
MDFTEEQRQAVQTGAAVVVLLDQTECVLMRKDVFDRIRAIGDEPLSLDEQRYLLREIGNMAGWNDPEMDVYDELDPRRTS